MMNFAFKMMNFASTMQLVEVSDGLPVICYNIPGLTK